MSDLKIRLCIIDDQGNEIDILIDKIEKYPLIELVDISDENLFAANTADEGTGVEYTFEQQKENVIEYLKKQWDDFDVLLIDLSLFGSKDENAPISLDVLNTLLSEEKYKKSVLNREKYIIIITGKGSTNLNSKLKDIDLNNIVFSLHKPSDEMRVDIDQSSCPCTPGCLSGTKCCKYYQHRNLCNRDDCLFEIIRAIHNVSGGKTDE